MGPSWRDVAYTMSQDKAFLKKLEVPSRAFIISLPRWPSNTLSLKQHAWLTNPLLLFQTLNTHINWQNAPDVKLPTEEEYMEYAKQNEQAILKEEYTAKLVKKIKAQKKQKTKSKPEFPPPAEPKEIKIADDCPTEIPIFRNTFRWDDR